MNFAIIAHPDKYIVAPPLKAVLKWCLNHHTDCFAREALFDIGEAEHGDSFVAVNDDQEAVNRADMVIAIGGDGTMLYTAQLTIGIKTPVLGINCGRLGFMANIQQEKIEESLNAVKSGEYRIDERAMLEASVNNSKPYYALNEFLFTKKDTTSLVTLTVRYDGHFVNRYWSDGLIVATPTGSTAYNLSTGGPIVIPGTPVMVLTPINPHTLTTRPLVLPSDKTLTVRVEESADHILFSNDGRIMEIDNGNLEVNINSSVHTVHLIQMKEQNYFDTLRTKLMWGMDSRKK
jgi:NAD+ kinase